MNNTTLFRMQHKTKAYYGTLPRVARQSFAEFKTKAYYGTLPRVARQSFAEFKTKELKEVRYGT